MSTDSVVLNQYHTLKQELHAISSKMSELEMEADEHKLVIAALTPLPPNRTCWRRVGGVLVESTVEQTLPILSANLEGIEKALSGLREALKGKESEYIKIEEKLSNSK